MSDEELIGRLQIQSKQAEKRQTRAELQARQISGALRSIAVTLDAGHALDPIALEAELALLPTREEARALLREIEEARKARTKADSDLRQAESLL